MPKPWLEADAIRFGEEEAIRMHALGTEKPDARARTPLMTYTLLLFGPEALSPALMAGWLLAETKENLNDLLPEGYEVEIRMEEPEQ